jgi:uncharacterized damage-inducible protein DinB
MNSNTEVAALQEHFERFRGVTLQMLEMIPEERLAWRPTEKLRSFAELFLHIARAEYYYARGFFAGDWNLERLKPPSGPLSREDLRRELTEPRPFLTQHLEALDAARLDSIPQVPNVPIPWSLCMWLWYLVEHEVHHKSQLALYMRQVGIKPPFFAFVFPGAFRPDEG